MQRLPFSQWGEKEITEIKNLLGTGFVLVMAHIERYIKYQKNRRAFKEILDLPLYTQINAESVFVPFKRFLLIKMLKDKKITMTIC